VSPSGLLPLGMVLAACDARGNADLERMLDQQKVEPYESTPEFRDGLGLQRPPLGSIAREASAERPARSHSLVQRGQNRFGIFCAPCHGLVGDGHSEVARWMSLRPPISLHEPKVRALSDERLFGVVTEGYGLMPAYAASLAPSDRWAVVAYVRVLQRSQHVELEALSAEERGRFER
jgi:mono/diheme cytochrome c family protein